MPRKLASFILVFFLLFSAHSALFPPSAQALPPAIDAALSVVEDALNAAYNLSPCIGTGLWYDPTECEFRKKVYGSSNQEIFGERYTFAQVSWIIHSSNLITSGANTPDRVMGVLRNLLQSAQKISQGQPAQPIALSEFGQLGLAGLIIGSIQPFITTPVSSGIKEIAHHTDKLLGITPASAQGYGFESLGGIRNLWAASRNSAYLVMVVLLIAAGFAVMFRLKVNPQTAVTIQLMIPKIVITLLAVTFSYAIAGLIIDLTYVVLGFIIYLMSSPGIGLFSDPARGFSAFTNWGFAVVGVIMIVPLLIVFLLGLLTVKIPVLGFLGAATAILALICLIIMFVLLAKVWWMLIKSYLFLLVHIITGPWRIMLGLLPSTDSQTSVGFTPWLRALAAEASVFVVTPVMFILTLFLWVPTVSIGGVDPFGLVLQIVKDLIFGINQSRVNMDNLPSVPLLGNVGFLFNVAIGFAIMALTPKAADMVKDVLKQPQFKYGAAFGEAISGGADLLGWAYDKDTAARRAALADEKALWEKRFKDAGPGTPDEALARQQLALIQKQLDRIQSTQTWIGRLKKLKP